MTICGKDKFDPTDKNCLTCSENLACIIEEAKEKKCPLGHSIERGYPSACTDPTFYNCNLENRQICIKIAQVLQSKKSQNCKFFGEQTKNPDLEACLKCSGYTFMECEASELLLKNLEISLPDAREHIQKEASKAERDPADCYPNFEFEETCWEGCDYKIRCMRESGIKPGKECCFYPKINQQSSFYSNKLTMDPKCKSCPFYETCFALFSSEAEEINKEKEKNKAFSGFFSLREIRNILTEED